MTKLYTALAPSEIDCLVENVNKAPEGIIVCAGTWRGGDLMAMIAAQPERYFVVIDSFHGLTEPVEEDLGGDERADAGMFNIDGKENYIQNFIERDTRLPNEMHEMWITNETIQTIKKQPIAMLWLDLDHFKPTRTCLQYFKENIVKDGIILVHDYALSITPGVKRACDMFYDVWSHQDGGIWRGYDRIQKEK